MEKFARARVRRSAMVALALALPVAAVAILPFPAKVVPNVYDYANYLFLDKTDCQGDHSDLPASQFRPAIEKYDHKRYLSFYRGVYVQ